MIAFNKIIKSDKIVLRPIAEEDFKPMKALTADPEMWTYFTTDLSNDSELKEWIDTAIQDGLNKKRLALSIIDRSTNKILGSTSIGNISEKDNRVEIGWTWISKDYQGKGFNAEVKYLLLKYCIENCKIERVEFKTDVLNIPARKAMTKIGLIEEGVLRSHTKMIRNRRRDTIFYSVLKSEWEEMKNKNNWL